MWSGEVVVVEWGVLGNGRISSFCHVTGPRDRASYMLSLGSQCTMFVWPSIF